MVALAQVVVALALVQAQVVVALLGRQVRQEVRAQVQVQELVLALVLVLAQVVALLDQELVLVLVQVQALVLVGGMAYPNPAHLYVRRTLLYVHRENRRRVLRGRERFL